MKRSELVEILKRAAPALSTKDLVPSFSCFFFKDGKVTAYDDAVAIETVCDLKTSGDAPEPLTGGLRGKLLMEYLAASKSDELEVFVDGTTCVVKAGRGKLSIPILPMDDFMFEWPKDEAKPIQATDDMMTAISACYASIGLDPSVAWRIGITVVFGKRSMTCYSSDNYSLTRATAPAAGPDGLATILPPKFCELLIAKGRPEKLLMTETWVEARYADGTRLFSRTLSEVSPENFSKVMDSVKWDENFVDVPKGLDGALDRAMVVLSSSDEPHSELTVTKEDGRLKMYTKGPIGESRDLMKMPDHENATCRVRPELLRRPLSYVEKMRLIEGMCVAFIGPGFRHMIAVTT